jgi:hypothetical protein
MSHDKRPDARPEQSLASRSGESTLPRPDTDFALGTAAPIERYYSRCFKQAWDDFRAKLQQEKTIGGVTGSIMLLITTGLFIWQIVPWVSLLPVGVLVTALLGYFIYVLFRAPAKLDDGRQSQINGLAARIIELSASAENHARDVKTLTARNGDLESMVREIQDEKDEIEAERNALKLRLDEERTEPYIKGELKEVHIESWFPPDYAKQGSIVWYVTIYVHIVNLRAVTTIQDYRLALSVQGHEYEGHPVSLASYYITRRVERPVHLEIYIDEVEEALVDLRQFNLTPLEHNIGRAGWLRFKVSGIPILEDDAPQRSDEMSLVLYVVDAIGKSHSIPASSPWNQMGEIRRRR